MNTRPFDRVVGVVSFATLMMALLVCMLLMSGCSGSSQPSNQQAPLLTSQGEGAPLRVAVQYNALSIPTVFAYENGYFSDEGLDVGISTFVNGAEENKALEKGDVDVASDGLASVYLLATGKFSWIGESDNGSSTIGVYVREGSAPTQVSGQLEDNPNVLGSADTLRGLSVAGPAGTMEEWTAVSFFSQFGLSADTDFEFVELDRNQAVDSVLSGEADMFIATDIDYCRLMEENGFVALAKGAEATNVPFNNGYVVSNEVLETRYDDLVAFLVAVYRASETLSADRDLWNNFALEYYKANGKIATLEDVEQETQIRGVLLPSDFESTDYRLGSGVLDVGRFHAGIGALDETQVVAIQDSINTQVLEDALGIKVQPAMIED